jgi:FlaA1/EpsC-like NDP-sugar epimerase
MTRVRNRHLLAVDGALLAVAPFLLYALRFEGFAWPASDRHTAVVFTLVTLPVTIATFFALGLYAQLWRYASVREVIRITLAGAVAALLQFAFGAIILPDAALTPVRVPLSVLFTNALLSIAIVAVSRLLIRMEYSSAGWNGVHGKRVLIAGAGAAGGMLLKELRENGNLNLCPIGFVDDDPLKHGLRLSGLPVFGPLAHTAAIIRRERIQMLVVAMPTAPGAAVRPIVRAALDAGIEARTLPALGEIVSGKVRVSALREVRIEDLLRREPVQTDLAEVAALATGRTVLVTGAGGSIGSELSRQIAQLKPAKLVVLGHGENPIFEILQELRPKHPGLPIVPVIADVRDRRRIRAIFQLHRPYSVFHAAAHKHVPLMEENVVEAVTNNVAGTWNVVDAAIEHEVRHFVLISTDKAVRPSSVMGATKRVAEHIVQEAALTHGRNFVAVRFGNVLGSQGSVVPTFVRQIKAGGPVTVTHPDMRRYFMTIPEAVQLVLQAGALGKGGELFMLDMGEPVRVIDLARDLIRLSGLEVGTDVEIKITGMRRGEKLHEEMFFSDEAAAPTNHPKVLRARRQSLDRWEGAHTGALGAGPIRELIEEARGGCDEVVLCRLLHRIVPDFQVEAPEPAVEREVRTVAAPLADMKPVANGNGKTAPMPVRHARRTAPRKVRLALPLDDTGGAQELPA